MSEKYDEFMDELEQDRKKEEQLEAMKKIWHKYGKYISALVIVSLLGSSGYVMWQKNEEKKSILNSEKIFSVQSLVTNRPYSSGQNWDDKALVIVKDIADNSNKFYKMNAGFFQAFLEARKDHKISAETYKKIAADTSFDKKYRDLASLFASFAILDGFNQDKPSKQALDEAEAILEPMTKGDSAFRLAALEMYGVVAFEKGEVTKSQEAFRLLIQDNKTPPNMKARANLMLKMVNSSK